jgi:hypothetical protein
MEHGDHDVRKGIVDNLLLHGPPTRQALPILRKALLVEDSGAVSHAVYSLLLRGRELLPEEAAQLDCEFQEAQNDRVLAIVLLSYFGRRASHFEEARRRSQRLHLWLIKSAPELASFGGPVVTHAEDRSVFEEAKRLWLEQVRAHEGNTAILKNAAGYFAHSDPELSGRFLRQAQSLEPDNPEWGRELASVHEREMWQCTGELRHQAAIRTLRELEGALQRETNQLQRFLMLPGLAKAAFEASEAERAGWYATLQLEISTKPGYFYHKNGPAVHYGNLILGRLALRAGQLGEAKMRLLEAGTTVGSPALKTGGPNMMLAKELLELGERDTVVEFLKRCSSFWQSDDQKVDQWIYTIEHGGIPDFGPNLHY